MDTRANFQRLLDDMDAVIRRKQQELSELDERLETAQEQLSEREAKELLSQQEAPDVAPAESNLVQQDIDDLMQEQQTQYEQQITNLNLELIELDSANQDLTKLNGQLRSEVDSLKVSNEKLRERLQMLDESLEEVHSANFELNIRLAKAESESQMQQKLLKKSHEQDQILMDAFNNKLESLKEAIASRDEELRRLHVDYQMTLESLGIEVGSDDDTDGAHLGKDEQLSSNSHALDNTIELNHVGNRKHRLIKIANLVGDKDAQIAELRNQLVQATRDLERSANQFETVNKENPTGEQGIDCNDTRARENDNDEKLLARCKMLEDELNEKDKHLHFISKRNRHLEKVLPTEIAEIIENLCARSRRMPGQDGRVVDDLDLAIIAKLTDRLTELSNSINSSQTLLDTVDQLQRMVTFRDAQIKRLVRELNLLNARINQDQIDVQPASPEEATEMPSNIGGEVCADRESTTDRKDQFADRLITDEGDELTVLGEGQLTVAPSEKEEEDSANSEKQESEASTVRESENVVAVSTKEASPLNSPKQEASPLELVGNSLSASRDQNRIRFSCARGRNRTSKLGLFGRHWVSRKRTFLNPTSRLTIDLRGRKRMAAARRITKGYNNIEQRQEQQAFNYRDRLRQLEGENQLLELAMKEILMSIKWSDSRCSAILIDCPSLERLCQLIEARYITTNGRDHSQSKLGMLDCADHKDEPSHTETRSASGEPSRERESKSDLNLFHLIMMKSELELLRGQNEQLKLDMKSQPRDRKPESRPHSLDGEHTKKERPESGRASPIRSEEAGCQTDSLILIDPSHLLHDQQAKAIEGPADGSIHAMTSKGKKCRNCSRLVSLANHLLGCIVRIESRVNSSDESYINRMLTLYQLSQQLSQDLSMRDNLINQLRRDNQRLSQQKLMIQSRLHTVETYLKVHNSTCPLHNYVPRRNQHETLNANDNNNQKAPADVQWYSAIRNGPSQSIHSLTIRSNQKLVEVPLKDSRIAISLLQSIIACLQARLDYKDERLNQLEQLLIAN